MYKLENKFVSINAEDIQSVTDSLRQKQLAGTADVVKTYEQKLSEYFAAKYAHACNSGTAGIELILRALGVDENSEVLLPPTGPVMCVLPIIAIGAKPVFVDVDSSSTFGIDIEDLQRKITKKTKALLVVPMWGYPIEMSEIRKICQEKRIILIEDASHCHGSKLGEHYVGTLADLSIFSTQERKLVTTGEGGFVLTNTPEISQVVQEMRNFGRATTNVAYFDRKVDDFGVRFGLNFRLSATNAALGISQLEKLDNKIKQRTRNAEYIRESLNNCKDIEEIPILSHAIPNYYSIVFKIKNMTNNAVFGKYLDEHGIISDTYRFNYMPLYQMPLFSSYVSSCPNAESVTKSIFTLPTHEGLIQKDLDHIISTVKDFYANT